MSYQYTSTYEEQSIAYVEVYVDLFLKKVDKRALYITKILQNVVVFVGKFVGNLLLLVRTCCIP